MGVSFYDQDRSLTDLTVPEKQPVSQWFTLTGHDLDHFRGLDGADDRRIVAVALADQVGATLAINLIV